MIDRNAFIELVPWRRSPAAGRAGDADNIFQIYVTTRDREAMPLLRYHTGDIVQCEPIGLMEQFEDGHVDHNVLACPVHEETTVTGHVKTTLIEFVQHVFEHVRTSASVWAGSWGRMWRSPIFRGIPTRADLTV